ncbi:MAG: SVM family protein [Candidatus Phytoplasma pyri]
MFKFKNQFINIIFYSFILLELFFVINNNYLMAMKNSVKHNINANDPILNDEILNDKMYLVFQKEQFLTQQRLTEDQLNEKEKTNLLIKHDYISQKMKNYKEKKSNNKITKTKNNDKGESSSQHKNSSSKK